MGYEWLALAAASLWAVAALISVKPARHLGAFAYSRWRMFLVSLMLASASLITGGWQTLTESALPLLALSSGCASSKKPVVVIRVPPPERLTCKAEPDAPAIATDASVSRFIVDLAESGQSCRSALRWVKDWAAGVSKR